MSVTLDDIRAAAAVIQGDVIRTPLVPAPRLSRRLGCELYLKLENLQYTGSFKEAPITPPLSGVVPNLGGASCFSRSSQGLPSPNPLHLGEGAKSFPPRLAWR